MFQIIWESYKDVIDNLPNFCKNGQDIWQTVNPLICFHISEWHHPDRVLRQFDLKQNIPSICNTEPLLHNIDLRVTYWSDRVTHLVVDDNLVEDLWRVSIQQFDMDVTQEYIHWYNNIMKLYITRPGAVVDHLVHI